MRVIISKWALSFLSIFFTTFSRYQYQQGFEKLIENHLKQFRDTMSFLKFRLDYVNR
jgi:hypothetical protein